MLHHLFVHVSHVDTNGPNITNITPDGGPVGDVDACDKEQRPDTSLWVRTTLARLVSVLFITLGLNIMPIQAIRDRCFLGGASNILVQPREEQVA